MSFNIGSLVPFLTGEDKNPVPVALKLFLLLILVVIVIVAVVSE